MFKNALENLEFIHNESSIAMTLLIILMVAALVILIRVLMDDSIFTRISKSTLFGFLILIPCFVYVIVDSTQAYSAVQERNIQRIEPWLEKQGISISKERLYKIFEEDSLNGIFASNPSELLLSSKPFKYKGEYYNFTFINDSIRIVKID